MFACCLYALAATRPADVRECRAPRAEPRPRLRPVPLSDEELHELEGRLPSGRADWNVDFRERKWWKEFDSLLRALSKKPDAAIFSRPVDPISDGIPDYFDIIHHPMDLGTIRQRLDTDFYVHPEDFIDDVRRVFRNCFTYNKEDSPVAKMGARLSQIFEHDLHKKFLHIDV